MSCTFSYFLCHRLIGVIVSFGEELHAQDNVRLVRPSKAPLAPIDNVRPISKSFQNDLTWDSQGIHIQAATTNPRMNGCPWKEKERQKWMGSPSVGLKSLNLWNGGTETWIRNDKGVKDYDGVWMCVV